MADPRRTSTLAIVLTLAGVLVAFVVGGWLAVAGLAAFYAAPAVPASGPAVSKAATPASVAASSASAAAAPASASTSGPRAASPATATGSAETYVVVVDAGHQRHPDLTPEPIGPGAKETKPAVASGTRGVATKNPENVINLAVSLMLRDELQRQPGVRVVMIRTTPDVDIPNSERAKIAAAEGADLLIRVHCDGVNDPKIHGLLTMVPTNNRWTGPIFSESARAGRFVQDATLKSTGAADRGILRVGNMSGFNWSTVPSVIVEMGVMTNTADDHRLADPLYQRKLAEGMAAGVVDYLHSAR